MTTVHLAATASTVGPGIIDWLTVAIASGAMVASIVALIYNRSSAESARVAAEAARDSASSSKTSADAAADLLRVELERQHEHYAPTPTGRWVFRPRSFNIDINGLVYLFKLDRDYRVQATATAADGNGATSCAVTAPDAPDGEWVAWVEDWTAERTHSAFRTLTLRFWPPHPSESRAKPWFCRCGGSYDHGDEVAHWDIDVRVVPPTT